MLLENKTAIVYGAAGAIGSAVARAYAREGAPRPSRGPHHPQPRARRRNDPPRRRHSPRRPVDVV